jgi:uncharacterized membrane protein YtjA (UPF0391 family)
MEVRFFYPPYRGNKGDYFQWHVFYEKLAVTNYSKPLNQKVMLRWSLIFFVVAIIAAIFGFTGIAAASAGIAKVLFFIFLVLFLLTLIVGGTLVRKR